MVNVKPVTLYDVAEYAGVSYQTVSRVVNQASHVSAKTREKVEAAMAELNYIPNRVAQQLAGKQSLLIGVATSSLALHAPSQIVAAIKSRADQLGASVVVSMVERSGVEACKAAVHNLLAQRVSGLIINYPLDDQDAIAVEAACTNVPALFLDVSDQTPINSIIFSHEDGTRLGVEHLVALGHQQIALLAGPLSSVSARLRLAGWHKYLTRNQIQPIAEREGDWSAMSGFQQTMQMLNEGIVPTAMLVANDQMALGAMRAITESGLIDYSLIAGMIGWGEGITPMLAERLETEIKYAGYIARQDRMIHEVARHEKTLIPEDFSYTELTGLTLEAREKLARIRPKNLGQAGRIPGVSPSDVAQLSIALAAKRS